MNITIGLVNYALNWSWYALYTIMHMSAYLVYFSIQKMGKVVLR